MVVWPLRIVSTSLWYPSISWLFWFIWMGPVVFVVWPWVMSMRASLTPCRDRVMFLMGVGAIVWSFMVYFWVCGSFL